MQENPAGGLPGAVDERDTLAPPVVDDQVELRRIARSTSSITFFTALSRGTGFLRVMVVVAVLGTTALGNTYESANSIPNMLFELFAAGVLQAVLIPTLVTMLDSGEDADAEHVASSVLGLACALLAGLAAIAMVAAPVVARLLFSGVSDPARRADQVHLGTIFLWFFLPQVVFYAAGMVATGVLNARHRFAVPAAAPLVNNFVVIGAYLVFLALRHGKNPSLHLTSAEVVVLAGGTTLAVVLFCGLPVLSLLRSGFRLRLRFDYRHPAVRRIARLGLWAAAYLAVTQLLYLVVLVLANRIPGGVVAYDAAMSWFLLPHALIALPVLTALFPTMSRQIAGETWPDLARSLERGVRTISYFVLPASAGLLVLGPVLARTLLVGHVGGGGATMVGRTIGAFAPGLLGYGLFLFASRVFYGRHDARTPALVNVGVAIGGAGAMIVAFSAANRPWRVPGLALAHSVAYSVGALAMVALCVRTLPSGERPHLWPPILGAAVASTIAGLVMWAVTLAMHAHGRVGGLIELGVAGAAGGAVYFLASAVVGGPRPTQVVGLLRRHGA